ncbi:MAG: SDR family oxidoreductase [Actinomycetaceae bacterium]|nr:SDR family oxidoreductase [Actinomycetaceae bacterium]
MKITVVGGSRGIGAEVARRALDAGHEVTVVSRSGARPVGVVSAEPAGVASSNDAVSGDHSDDAAARTRIIRGDASTYRVAEEAIAGADVVVVAVGGIKGHLGNRARVTRSCLRVMNALGMRRLIVVSALGAGGSAEHMPGPVGSFVRLIKAVSLVDHNEQEAAVREFGEDWTIVRPSMLTDGPFTGEVMTRLPGMKGTLRRQISRADLADYIVENFDNPDTYKQAISISGQV